MIVIDGVKYACRRCIRGHRVSGCDHYDEELFIIKRKGRPSSLCIYCRRSRQARNTRLKCLCVSTSDTCASAACQNAHLSKYCTCAENKPQQPQTIPAGSARALIAASLNTAPVPQKQEFANFLSHGGTNDGYSPYNVNAVKVATGTTPMDNLLPPSPPDSLSGESSDGKCATELSSTSPYSSDSVLENMSMNSLSSVNDVPLKKCVHHGAAANYENARYPAFGSYDVYALPLAQVPDENRRMVADQQEPNYDYVPASLSRMSYLYGC